VRPSRHHVKPPPKSPSPAPQGGSTSFPHSPCLPGLPYNPSSISFPTRFVTYSWEITATPELLITRQGEDILLALGEREYRVRGLDKNGSHEALRVNLRLMVGGLYHVNILDLYQAKQRQSFIEDAAKETLLASELIKRDLGKILLQLELLQEERLRQTQAGLGRPRPRWK
jgi:hypothetical protein